MKPSQIIQVAFLALMVMALPATVWFANRPSTSENRAQAGRSERIAIYADPSSIETSPGSEFSIQVKADTGSAVIGGIMAVVRFDPSALTLVSANPGAFFSGLNPEVGQGMVTLKTSERVVGNGTVATLTFRASGSTDTEITFGENTELFDPEGKTDIKTQSPQPVKISITR